MQKITPFLWYSKEAEEAAAFYASVFPDSRINRVTALPSESQAGVGRDAEDGQDRHRCLAGGIRGNDGGARAGSLILRPSANRRFAANGGLTPKPLKAAVRWCHRPFRAQCRVPPFPGPFALVDTASTNRVKVRCSFGFIAPTPMSLRAISSPRSLRIDTTTVYSHGSPSAGCRMLPSILSGVSAGA